MLNPLNASHSPAWMALDPVPPPRLSICVDELHEHLAGMVSPETVLRRNEPLARRTTLRVGGPADIYLEPSSEDELARVLQFCAAHGLPVMALGRGSNLLVRDGGVRGVVLNLGHATFSRIAAAGETLCCGAGARMKAVANEARRLGLAGFEFLEGIPGSIGGGLRMNAGAMGSCLFDVVESVRFMDFQGRAEERPASRIPVQYRCCGLLRKHLVLSAVLKGTPAPIEKIAEKMKDGNRKRWESQPAAPSAGCIFKNPLTIPAGKLVEELGLKGARIGGAVISGTHGNFIVNEGTATAAAVLKLIALIQEKARVERGIDLETEVEIVGEPAGDE